MSRQGAFRWCLGQRPKDTEKIRRSASLIGTIGGRARGSMGLRAGRQQA